MPVVNAAAPQSSDRRAGRPSQHQQQPPPPNAAAVESAASAAAAAELSDGGSSEASDLEYDSVSGGGDDAGDDVDMDLPPLETMELPPMDTDGGMMPTKPHAMDYRAYMADRRVYHDQNEPYPFGLSFPEMNRLDQVGQKAECIRQTEASAPVFCSADDSDEVQKAFTAAYLLLQDNYNVRRTNLNQLRRDLTRTKSAAVESHRENPRVGMKDRNRRRAPIVRTPALSFPDESELRMDTASRMFGRSRSLHVRLAAFVWLAQRKSLKYTMAFQHVIMTLLHQSQRFPTVDDVIKLFEVRLTVMADGKKDYVSAYETQEVNKSLPDLDDLLDLNKKSIAALTPMMGNAHRTAVPSSVRNAPSSGRARMLERLHAAPQGGFILFATQPWFVEGLVDLAAYLGNKYPLQAAWACGTARFIDPQGYDQHIRQRLSSEEAFARSPQHLAVLEPILSHHCELKGSKLAVAAAKAKLTKQATLSPYATVTETFKQIQETINTVKISPGTFDPDTLYEVYMTPGMHSSDLIITSVCGYRIILFKEIIYDVLANDLGESLLHLSWSERLTYCERARLGIRIPIKTLLGSKLEEHRAKTMSLRNKAVECSLMYSVGPGQYVRFTHLLKKKPAHKSGAVVPSVVKREPAASIAD